MFLSLIVKEILTEIEILSNEFVTMEMIHFSPFLKKIFLMKPWILSKCAIVATKNRIYLPAGTWKRQLAATPHICHTAGDFDTKCALTQVTLECIKSSIWQI